MYKKVTKMKTTRDLEKELKRARNEERNSVKVIENKNFDFIGVDPEAKSVIRPDSAEVPDYIGKPKKKRSAKLQDSLPY
jgi:C4-type Zn-finger protein